MGSIMSLPGGRRRRRQNVQQAGEGGEYLFWALPFEDPDRFFFLREDANDGSDGGIVGDGESFALKRPLCPECRNAIALEPDLFLLTRMDAEHAGCPVEMDALFIEGC